MKPTIKTIEITPETTVKELNEMVAPFLVYADDLRTPFNKMPGIKRLLARRSDQ